MKKSLPLASPSLLPIEDCKDVPLPGLVAASGVLGNLPIAVSPALLVAAQSSGLSEAIIGVFSTLFMASASLVGLVTALFAHRVPPRRTVLFCFAIFVIANAAAVLFPSTKASLAALLIAGTSAGVASSIATRLIAQSSTPDTVAAKMGIWGAIVLILCGGGAAWAAQFGMAGVHATISLAALLAMSAILTLPVDPPRRLVQNALRTVDYRAVFLLLGVFLYATKDGVAWSLSQTIAVNHGFSANEQAVLLATIGCIGVLGAGLAVWCSKYVGWLAPSVIAIFLNITFGTSQYLVQSNSLFAFLTCAYTASHIFLIPFLLGLASSADANGRVVAAVASLLTLGSAVGPILGTALLAHGGVTRVSALMLIVTVLAACLWLAPAARRYAVERAACRES